MSTATVEARSARTDEGAEQAVAPCAVGFSVRIDEEGSDDRAFLAECLANVIDEVDIELKGQFDVIAWRVNDQFARGVFFADMAVKSVARGVGGDLMKVSTPSVSSILSETSTMKSMVTTVESLADSKAARALIEKWQAGKSAEMPLKQAFRERENGETGAEYMQAFLDKIGETDWTDVDG